MNIPHVFLMLSFALIGAAFLLFAVRLWADTSAFLGPFSETGDWIPFAVFGCASVMASMVWGALIFLNRVTP